MSLKVNFAEGAGDSYVFRFVGPEGVLTIGDSSVTVSRRPPVKAPGHTSDTFANVRLVVVLAIAHRAGVSDPLDAASADRLIGDMILNGIDLGHGTNKGFGWFKVCEGARNG